MLIFANLFPCSLLAAAAKYSHISRNRLASELPAGVRGLGLVAVGEKGTWSEVRPNNDTVPLNKP